VKRIVAGDTRPAEKQAEEELVALAARVHDVEDREQRLLDAHLATLFTPAAIAQKAEALRAERAALEQRIRKVRASRGAAARAVQETKTLRSRLLGLQLRVRTADEETRAKVLHELVRSTRVEYIGPHRARLHVAWIFAGAAAHVSSDVRDASESETSLETIHELGRAA